MKEINESTDLRLLIELSNMYYNDGATQQEIADKFQISRSLVSKYLANAREVGVVEITIHDEMVQPYRDVEKILEGKYGIREVICVPSDLTEENLKVRLGLAASRYLIRVVKPHDTIGISAGTTLLEVARAVSPYTKLPDNTFIPMVGGLGTEYNDIHAHVLCDILSRKTNAKKMELYTPLLLDSTESRDVFMRQPFIKEVIDHAKKVDIALIGIGGPPESNKVTQYYFNNENESLNLGENTAVGDIGYIFVDEFGNEVDTPWNQRILGLHIKDLLALPSVVVIAGGKNKFKGIQAAARRGIIDVLITDVDTAKRMTLD